MNKKEQDMSSKSDNSEVQLSKIATQEASDVRFSRRNMLLASSAAVAAPALGTALTVDIARAQQGRFEYSSDRIRFLIAECPASSTAASRDRVRTFPFLTQLTQYNLILFNCA